MNGDQPIGDDRSSGFEQEPQPEQRAQWPGTVVAGAILVLVGVSLLVARATTLPEEWRSGIWPLLLMAVGVAKLLQPTRHGREGLFFVLAGAWWLAGVVGWLSLSQTWPLLIVAFGASVIVQGLTTPRAGSPGGRPMFPRHSGTMTWIAVAIVALALIRTDAGGWTSERVTEGTVRLVSVMGRGDRDFRGARFSGGDVVTAMGRSMLDLRDATVQPDETLTLDVTTIMGASVIVVPESWDVDSRTLVAMGRISDERRDTGPRPAGSPRLIVRGTVLMGTLIITS